MTLTMIVHRKPIKSSGLEVQEQCFYFLFQNNFVSVQPDESTHTLGDGNFSAFYIIFFDPVDCVLRAETWALVCTSA